jgi:hypothetical protein
MLPRLLRFVAAVLLACSLSLPLAWGQANKPPPPDSSLPTVDRGVQLDTSVAEKGPPSYGLAYFVLAIFTMLILTIMCMPSRKA